MRSIAIVLLIILAVFSFSQVQATIIHVPGDQPTIGHGIGAAAPGDTVLVAPGIYYETIGLSNPILVKSETGPENTVISASGLGTVVELTGAGILDGFTIQDGAAGQDYGGGITCEGCYATMRNNIITDNAGGSAGGILCHDSHARIEDNIVYGNTSPVTGGIDLSGASGDTVVGNLIYGNSKQNLQSPGGGGMSIGGDYWPSLVQNNTISYNVGDGIHCYIGGGTTIKNNVICYNSWGSPGAGYGIYFYQPQSYVCEYNDVYGNSGGDFVGVVPGEGCFSADPLFCDASNDFHLFNTSPCIGVGEGGVTIGALEIGCTVEYGVQVIGGTVELVSIAREDSITFYIQNIGLEFDSYDISVDDSLGWMLMPSQTQIILNPDQQDSILVTFQVPSVSFGTVNQVSLEATSQTLPSITDSYVIGTIAIPLCGDVNWDGTADVSDVVYTINYLFRGGPPPCEP